MKITDLIVVDDLGLTYLRGRGKFNVAWPFRLAWNYGRWHRRLTVPLGSPTSGTSYFPAIDDGLIAAAVHDYLRCRPHRGRCARPRDQAPRQRPGVAGLDHLGRRPRLRLDQMARRQGERPDRAGVSTRSGAGAGPRVRRSAGPRTSSVRGRLRS